MRTDFIQPEKCIRLVEGQQKFSIDYGQVLGIYRLKSCSVLMFTRQNGIMYVESQFSIGNREEFERFILERCPQVKEIAEWG